MEFKELNYPNTSRADNILCTCEADERCEVVEECIKALEQQPSSDVMAIHTQGLDEGIRCAMCTNSMRSDRGCDGGCVINEDMYKKVMETINNQMFSQPTSEDCVSRKAVIDLINADWKYEGLELSINELPPVTPTHGTCKDCSRNGTMRCKCLLSDGNLYMSYKNPDFYCADFEKRGNSDGSN